jgi:hypothetical protein
VTTLQGWLSVSPGTHGNIWSTIQAFVCAPLRVVLPARAAQAPETHETPRRLQPGVERC